MGEVYRAEDTLLGRQVPVKILYEDPAMNSVALSRFRKEAKALAALSHPNILAIHDFSSDISSQSAVAESGA